MKILKEVYSVFNDSQWLQDRIKPEDLPLLVDNFYKGVGGYGLVGGISKTMVTKNHVDTGDIDNIVGYVANVGCDEDGRVWAELEIQDEPTIEKFRNNLIPDVSIGWVRDSKEEGYKFDHCALVRVPAVKGMQHFILCEEEGREEILIDCKGVELMDEQVEQVSEVEKKDVPVEDDLWARFELYCQEQSIDPMVEISNLIESYMAPDEEPMEQEAKENPNKTLIDKIRGLFRKEKVEEQVVASESEVTQVTAKEVIEPVQENLEVLELKAKLEEEENKNKEIIEAKRVEDWNRIWDSNLGIKVLPKEKELYKELIFSPDKLQEMLELREPLDTFKKRERIELSNPEEEGLEYDPVIHEMGLVKHVKERGLDKPEKKHLYDRLVSDLKAQKQKQEENS